MREVRDFNIPGDPVRLLVNVLDQPMDGASSDYVFQRESDGANLGNLHFHHGEISEINDVNGVSMETVIGVLIDRLETLQKSPFADRQYEMALKRLNEAHKCLVVRVTHEKQSQMTGAE